MSASSESIKIIRTPPEPAHAAGTKGAARGTLAFADAYDRYGRQLYNYVCWQMGNVHDADDVFAAVCEKVFLKLGTFDERKASLSRWLFTIARHAVIDEKRGRRRRVTLSLGPETASRAPGAEEALVRGEQDARLMRLVSTLESREREIIGLRFSAGMSNREIGRWLHLREGTVAVILHRAIHRLRERREWEERS